MKKCIAILTLAVFTLLSTVVFAADVEVNPTGFPIVNEKITLKGFARLDPQHGPWEEMTLWKDYEEMTNIHIVWDTPGKQNVDERKNLVLALVDLDS